MTTAETVFDILTKEGGYRTLGPEGLGQPFEKVRTIV